MFNIISEYLVKTGSMGKMYISTKGRYALRVMLDLAECGRDVYTPLLEISQRQDISEKYLESIFASLSKAGLVDAVRGKGGGYKLVKEPKEYTVESILSLTEKSMAPVTCLDGKNHECCRANECRTLPLWKKLDSVMNGYLESVTLEDLINGTV